ncbi:MAG: phenylacetate--CoA ligase family protein [bacterium]
MYPVFNEQNIEKLEKLFHFLKKNNLYYRNILRDFKGFLNMEDFFKLPFLTREDVYLFGLSGNKSLLSEGLKISYVFSTGGTTGKSKYVAYTLQEFEEVCNYLYICYEGIEEKDWVANLFMAGNMWASFLFVNKTLEKFKCTILPISGNTDTNLIKQYLKQFKSNCIIGIPTQIKQVLTHEILQENFVKKIFYGGESFLPEEIEFLKKNGCEFIKSGGYASVDADIIGYQCKHLENNFHHIFENHQIVEIIDVENGLNIWEEDKPGEVVVTNLDRYLTPVVRYKTGDLAKWVNSKCGCNKLTIQLLGRYDEWIRLASYDFYYQDFAKAFHPYNITLKINKSKNLVKVLVEEKSLNQEKLDLERITEKLKEINWQLKEGLEENLIKIEIIFVNELPRTNKKINVIYE